MKLLEGGNVFKNGDGQALTQRINQTDVDPTVTWLEELTGLDLHGELDPDTADASHPQGYPEKWLGSTGKKESSGDLDLDASDTTKEALVARLTQWCVSHGFKPEEYISPKAIVHFKTPIDGRPNKGYVQTDFTFLPDPAWGRFVLGGSSDQYKGRERNVLMNSIAKSMGYKLNQNAGIADRATNQLISNDPDKVAKILLNPRATRADLRSVENILKALEKDSQRESKLADFKQHMEREGLPFLEDTMESTNPYIEYNEVNFLARLRDRIVNQGMQKLIESEVQGGRAKGIEHLEDLVFRGGSRGIKQALDVVKHTATDTTGTTTVKWDGKPALVFGRDATGTFILTDVAGFGARGYDGLFTSPRQVRQHLAARDAKSAEQGKPATRMQDLAPIYDRLWPMLDVAVPKNYRGFFQGDLLYMSTPPLEAGNYVFTPNTVEYKIPAASDVGQRIGASEVGIAMHTRYAEPGAPKEPIGTFKFKPVEGLLLLEPVYAKENVRPDSTAVKQLRDIYNSAGAAIDQLFDPAELRALQITDLPRLCIDYINSRVGVGFDNLLSDLGPWLLEHAGPRKYNNIVEYLQSPRSNLGAMAAAFTAWELLHAIKMDLLGQLDLQHPGQEGWVMATPAGIAKAVNRLAGGFTAANRALNNPKQPA